MQLSLPKLEALPENLQDGSITMRLEEGVPIFSASQTVLEHLRVLLEKEQFNQLTKSEFEELERYEEIDDYLSHLNRVVRNLLIHGSTHS
jgi:hypothetical protein